MPRRERATHRIHMESAEVDPKHIRQSKQDRHAGRSAVRRDIGQGQTVDTEDTLVQEVRVSGLVEEAFVTDRDEVVAVDRLDISRDVLDPRRNGGGRASTRRDT